MFDFSLTVIWTMCVKKMGGAWSMLQGGTNAKHAGLPSVCVSI